VRKADSDGMPLQPQPSQSSTEISTLPFSAPLRQPSI
jgi:hypothetical protein